MMYPHLVSPRKIGCRQSRHLALPVGLSSHQTSLRSTVRCAIHSLCALVYARSPTEKTTQKKQEHAASCGHERFLKNVSWLTFFKQKTQGVNVKKHHALRLHTPPGVGRRYAQHDAKPSGFERFRAAGSVQFLFKRKKRKLKRPIFLKKA